ncbi:MAG: hypothetical protein Kapaf2KO_00680 [Candidatus Kapaibacteriales bacterium]
MITWTDITVEEADKLVDFYKITMGWEAIPVDMGVYNDYVMIHPDKPDDAICGICHKKGPNGKLPPAWIPYVSVEDIDKYVSRCKENGGEIFDGPRTAGEGKMCIIKDPNGSLFGLYEG